MPWSDMKSVPKALITAGLTLPQANVWASYYDKGKEADMKEPGAFAWHQFKQEYKEEGDGWVRKIKKQEIEIPYILKDEIILKEGEANGIFYSGEEIQKAIPYLLEEIREEDDPETRHKNSIFCDHDDMEEGTWKWVGHFENTRWDENTKALYSDIYIVDERIAKLVDYQKKMGLTRFGISPRLAIQEKDKHAFNIIFKGISLVIFPAGGPRLMLDKSGSFSATSSFFKTNNEERIVYGIVLEPYYVDCQDDWFDEEEIRQACHNFMENYRILTVQHQDKFGKQTPVMDSTLSSDWKSFWNLDILQNFIAPVTFTMFDQEIKKGSWVMVSKVKDDDVWEAVKKKEITGYSIGGHAE